MKLIADVGVGVTAIDADISISFAAHVQPIADFGVTEIIAVTPTSIIDAGVSISFAANVKRIADVGVGVTAIDAGVSISFAANVKRIADVDVGVTAIYADASISAGDIIAVSSITGALPLLLLL